MQLPKESIEVRESKPENVIISVDRAASIYWYDVRVPNVNALVERLKKVSVMKPQPEVQIRGDLEAQYEGVGKVHLRVPACRHHEGRLHHRAAGARRLTSEARRWR